MYRKQAVRVMAAGWRWGIVLWLLAANAPAQSGPDVVIFNEDDATGAGYYDASVPSITAPSELRTAASPFGGKLPILDGLAASGVQCALLEWKSASGGSWSFFIAAPSFQVQNATGYSNLVLFLNGPLPIAAVNLPRAGLEDGTNRRTPTVSLGVYLTTGLDADTNTWQRVVIPLTAFEPYGLFSLAHLKTVWFMQGNADNVTRSLWLDSIRVTDGRTPTAPQGVVRRTGDRSVVLHWARNSEANLAGYRVYRSPNPVGPFTLLNTQPSVQPGFADFAVTNGQTYYYTVRALNGMADESPGSVVTNATPGVFANNSAFLDYLQHCTFDFFWYEANPTNGLVRDRSQPASVVSVAGVGFGLTGIGIAVDRGWITREQGRERVLTTLRTLWNAPQGTNVSGTIGYKGWYYHLLRLDTAARDGTSELSSIDTGLLLAGVLDVRQFFSEDYPVEKEIRSLASAIFNRVDWQWMANGGGSLTMGWRPESGFLPWRWIGYNEAMILYIMGLGAANNPLQATQWTAWTSGYQWRTNYGQSYVEFPPLFGHQFSHCWIDFRHLGDAYMNSRNISYFENSRRATLAQRSYCIANPGGFAGYGSNVWGITACDGPGFGEFAGYTARGAPPAQNDDGTLAPTAVGGSLPFAPEVCLPALRELYDQFRTNIWTSYGFCDAFNLSVNWWDTDVLSIDQGAILLMIENYRTQSVWKRFMQVPEIRRGLQSAGFRDYTFMTPSVRSEPAAGAYTLTWPSTAGRSFQVEYSNDLISWLISPSGFVTAPAGGSVCSWVDAGPPATDSAPDTSTRRFYRVFRFGAP